MSAMEKTVAKAIIQVIGQVIGEISRLSPEIGDQLTRITKELESITSRKSG